MDFFDPESNDFLQCEMIFRDLYALREKLAIRTDVNAQLVASDEDLLVFARSSCSENVLESHRIGGD